MKKILLALAILFIIPTQSEAQAFYRDFSDNGYYTANNTQFGVLNLFPNPAVNNASVVLSYLPAERTFVDILDFNGQLRRSFSFNPGGRQLNFNVSFLERGYYIVRVREGDRLIDIIKMVKN
ncbi:MAG TPA: T9SS type A sorting domain-containing protein [Flavipsychrobacter sp.]|jgi:hypothetical protein|nr:T9SS type A sorting domain-containing protein [Flavipsychrobacter sp.]